MLPNFVILDLWALLLRACNVAIERSILCKLHDIYLIKIGRLNFHVSFHTFEFILRVNPFISCDLLLVERTETATATLVKAKPLISGFTVRCIGALSFLACYLHVAADQARIRVRRTHIEHNKLLLAPLSWINEGCNLVTPVFVTDL